MDKGIEGHAATPTAQEVLSYLDFFAGQENNAEEVRDFVQEAARMIDEGKTYRDFGMAGYAAFVEWCDERRSAPEESQDPQDVFERTAAALEEQAKDLRDAENVFKDFKDVCGAFNRAGWWLLQSAKELRKLIN